MRISYGMDFINLKMVRGKVFWLRIVLIVFDKLLKKILNNRILELGYWGFGYFLLFIDWY